MSPRRLEQRFRIDASHPCLDGHFPGQPVVPGVVLLDEILAILHPHLPEHTRPGFDAVKFLHPVLPGREVTVEILLLEDTARFSGSVDGIAAISGTMRLA